MTLYEADLELIQNTLSSLSLEVRTLLLDRRQCATPPQSRTSLARAQSLLRVRRRHIHIDQPDVQLVGRSAGSA